MAVYYFDTSALVKLYIEEPGTKRMLELTANPEEHTFALLELARVEFRAAVRRQQREGDLPDETADALLSDLDEHVQSLYLVQPLTASVVEEAVALLDRHPLRAYDAMQLAGAVVLQQSSPSGPTCFTCADELLLKAAEKEGLTGLNPANGTPP